MFTSLEHLISVISALKLEQNEISPASANLSLSILAYLVQRHLNCLARSWSFTNSS